MRDLIEPRLPMSAAQHKIINLLKTAGVFLISQLSCPDLYLGLRTWQCPMLCGHVKMAPCSHTLQCALSGYSTLSAVSWQLSCHLHYQSVLVLITGSVSSFGPRSVMFKASFYLCFPALMNRLWRQERSCHLRNVNRNTEGLQSAFEARRNPRCLFFKLSTHFCGNSSAHWRKPSEPCHMERCRRCCRPHVS